MDSEFSSLGSRAHVCPRTHTPYVPRARARAVRRRCVWPPGWRRRPPPARPPPPSPRGPPIARNDLLREKPPGENICAKYGLRGRTGWRAAVLPMLAHGRLPRRRSARRSRPLPFTSCVPVCWARGREDLLPYLNALSPTLRELGPQLGQELGPRLGQRGTSRRPPVRTDGQSQRATGERSESGACALPTVGAHEERRKGWQYTTRVRPECVRVILNATGWTGRPLSCP